MKQTVIAMMPWVFFLFGYKATAQESKENKTPKRETEEIIIRKKGNKDANLSIQITGDKVIINGKPLVEFNDNDITINKRKIIVRDGNKITFFGNGDHGDGNGMMTFEGEGDFGNMEHEKMWGGKGGAFLGVTTEKIEEGAKVVDVTKGSAAEKAGLQAGDIITKIGDAKIDGPKALQEAIAAKNAKDEIKVFYKREGKKEKSTKATLQERPAPSKSFSFNAPDGSFKKFTIPGEGMAPEIEREIERGLAEGMNGINEGMHGMREGMHGMREGMRSMEIELRPRQKLGIKIQDVDDGNGVKILDVEDSSAAAIAGLKKDDVVVEIAGKKIRNTDEAREQLHELQKKAAYTIKARRNGNEMTFNIKLPKNLKTADL